MINNLGTTSSELQINFGMLQIDPENSATGPNCISELFFQENIAIHLNREVIVKKNVSVVLSTAWKN